MPSCRDGGPDTVWAGTAHSLVSDTVSMSLDVPALEDLLSHLADFEQNTSCQDLDTLVQKSVNPAFCFSLGSDDESLSPLAAAACSVHLNVCETVADVANDNISN